ncbi:MAG: hypothetical protein E7409_00395 [Ruminococcaceae bacterium]|nr:hypothetical protein [Oscillospiraceae bacterium]
MVRPINLRADFGSLNGDAQNRIISCPTPVLSWGGYSDETNDFQTAYHITVSHNGTLLWDSGKVESAEPFARYSGTPLPVGKRIDFSVSIAGNDGVMSEPESNYFYPGTFDMLPQAAWICASEDEESVPVCFRKEFLVKEEITEAALFVSGIGYFEVTLNGQNPCNSYLNPSISDYTKTCYYCTIPDIQSFFTQGNNCIGITVADGWRRNNGDYLRIYNNNPAFFGTPCLWAALRLTLASGEEQWLCTDQSWQWCRGAITYSHLFNGETYNAANHIPGWNMAGATQDFSKVTLFAGTLGKLKPMTIPPIRVHKEFSPISIHHIGEGRYIADFGTNMAGVLRITLPKNMEKGSKITLQHAQLLHEDGSLNSDNLRGALCEDTYIASGDDRDLTVWQPTFTYHGFRYAEICGIPLLKKEDITAVMLCTDLESCSQFHCGNATINTLHQMLIQTERSTTHSAFNDTCGRSERMHWIDDGFARYPEIAYNFEIGKMFPHIMSLICDTQAEDGSTTCTAPHIYGKRPADPYNVAYTMLAEQAYLCTGNTDLLENYYDSLCAWQNCLLANSTDYIMNYTYYGDWVPPKYACDPNTMGGGAGSAYVPPVMVGTGCLLFNARMLGHIAKILGRESDVAHYGELEEKIKHSFLEKWYDPATCKVFNGAQGCQALALWLDILPEGDRTKAAKILRDDLVDNDYRYTTGYFCLGFICDVLIRYGYVDEFYELMTRDSYPALGYMIQCDATTGWEKPEYLTGNSMNAHIHPCRVQLVQTFYRHIVGIVPIGKGAGEFDIKPHFPQKLLSASMTYRTVRGDLSVCWKKIDGTTNLTVSVPFNAKANIYTPQGVKTVGSGFHTFTW